MTKTLQTLTEAETNSVLLKYVPKDQPSPGAWLDLVKTQVLGVTKMGQQRPIEDFVFFLNTCKRSGLDPLARQIYAVYRWDGRQGKEKMAIQVSIDGMRLVAQRSGFYGGQDDVRFEYQTLVNPVTGKKDKQLTATVTVYRLNPKSGERMPVTASARWDEYAQKDKDGGLIGMWPKMPYLMLGKVAEALALRKAFPQELSGLYATEEMTQADNPILKLELPKPEENKEPAKTSEETAEALISKREALKEVA